ncbi:protein of unknown function [Candidatus Filomicrobium marinum]|uniref:Uncharacterized protein n=1 Tax=Candidatus Filomicrobium marinum TaxID=1608628 RepID=A0A0D6JF16_9HYPH|nr:protein of unknown function [Candidatus Filomicrobium marinum]CPR19090.1 protein of unknown function [Candidatus Filomicrobium marinum]
MRFFRFCPLHPITKVSFVPADGNNADRGLNVGAMNKSPCAATKFGVPVPRRGPSSCIIIHPDRLAGPARSGHIYAARRVLIDSGRFTRRASVRHPFNLRTYDVSDAQPIDVLVVQICDGDHSFAPKLHCRPSCG